MEKIIKKIEKIEDITRYIDEVNFYTPDEAKKCRILLARVLRTLEVLNRPIISQNSPSIINKPINTQPQAEEKTLKELREESNRRYGKMGDFINAREKGDGEIENTQPQTEESEHIKLHKKVFYGVKDTPEEGERFNRIWGNKVTSLCRKCKEAQDTPEECKEKAKAFDDMHDILKPYHREAEYYPATLKRVLDEREREVYEKGKEYQANLDRACYGTSFEKLEKGIVDDKDPLAPKKGIDWSSPLGPMIR